MTAVGLIFSNIHDRSIPELTRIRTMASVPFGGRYRLIDFALSNMVNSDITKIGLITHYNYQSLLGQHRHRKGLGSGAPGRRYQAAPALYHRLCRRASPGSSIPPGWKPCWVWSISSGAVPRNISCFPTAM